MLVDIKKIKVLQKKPRDEEGIDSLAESMKEIGQIEAIVLNEKNEILSGRRRYFAAKRNGMEQLECTIFDSDAIDQELATIDSNLMLLPLGEVDHDQALSRRKKLYEQKYPETRQHAAKGTRAFTQDVSETLGISNRSVELAISRAEKASPLVTGARREGKLSQTVVNALVRLPREYQDKILPVIQNRSTSEVKNIVEMALQRDVDFAISRADKIIKKGSPLSAVGNNLDQLKKSLEVVLEKKASINSGDAIILVEKSSEVIELLNQFIEKYMPQVKPILRKHQTQESLNG